MENDVQKKCLKEESKLISNQKLNNPNKSRIKEESTTLLSNVNTNMNIDYSTITEKSMEITSQTTSFDLYKGFLFMLGSCFFKSLFSILCKAEMDRNIQMTSFHLLTFKAYFMLIITVIIAFYYLCKGEEKMIYVLSKGKLNLIVLRAVFSVISISLTIFALKYISISEVYSVFYIYPGMVMLLSYFILKEKVGPFDVYCLVSCFVGVLRIIRPSILFPSEASAIKGNAGMFLLVILGAFLKACEDIIIRNVGKEVHCLVVPSIYSVVSMVLYPLTLLFSEENLFVKNDLNVDVTGFADLI